MLGRRERNGGRRQRRRARRNRQCPKVGTGDASSQMHIQSPMSRLCRPHISLSSPQCPNAKPPSRSHDNGVPTRCMITPLFLSLLSHPSAQHHLPSSSLVVLVGLGQILLQEAQILLYALSAGLGGSSLGGSLLANDGLLSVEFGKLGGEVGGECRSLGWGGGGV